MTLHPDLTAAERRRLFVAGIDLFHRGEFFAAHEAWEEIWRSTSPEPKDLFQGLIQLAASFYHHFGRGRPAVARRVLAKGRRRLTPLAPACRGLDLAGLLAQVRRWEGWLGEPDGPPPPRPRIEVVDEAEVR